MAVTMSLGLFVDETSVSRFNLSEFLSHDIFVIYGKTHQFPAICKEHWIIGVAFQNDKTFSRSRVVRLINAYVLTKFE
jgi:hypothetical protein